MSALPTTVADGLQASIDHLDEVGWTQNQYINLTTGACCAAAAIHVATCNCPQNDELENLSLAKQTCTAVFRSCVAQLSKTLRERTDYDDGDIIEWNDDDLRAEEDIFEMFEIARDEARSWLE